MAALESAEQAGVAVTPDLHEALLDQQPDVVWCLQTEPEPRFLYVSPSCETVLGHPPQTFLDDLELWFRMVHRSDVHLLGVGVETVAPGDSPAEESQVEPSTPDDTREVLVRFFRTDGELRWAEVRLREAVEPDGSIRLYGVTRDVTARIESARESERARKRLTEAEELAGVGTYDWDVAGDRMWFSTNLFRILGQDPDVWELSYPAFESMMLEQHRKGASNTIAHAAETGVSFHDDVEIQRPDGAIRTLDIIGLVELDEAGQLARIHGVMKDITEERAAETARLLFIADAAHELRTPVAGVIGATSILRTKMSDLGDGEPVGQVLDLLDRQSSRLRDLSTSLLDLSTLESRLDAPHLVPVDVDEVIARVVELCRPPEGIDLVVEPSGLHVLAEPWRLERVLVNLVTNAHRYAESEIRVATKALSGAVDIIVTDDGPGVEPRDVDSLFTEFHRGPGEKGSGSGLGLAIVRRLAQTMRGTVSYREAPGGGACFVVRLRLPS